MITNFKLYENSKIKPRVGDYVICSYDGLSYEQINIIGCTKGEIDFVRDKIGKVIHIDSYIEYPYLVTYDNIPESISNGDLDGEQYLLISLDTIKHYSKNKGKLEIILNAKKFNI